MEAVARIALALAGHRQVDGDEDRLVAGVFALSTSFFLKCEIAHGVELEPEPPADLLRRRARC